MLLATIADGNLEGPTRKPRHASVFSMHSDTQAVPAFHCTICHENITQLIRKVQNRETVIELNLENWNRVIIT